MVGAFYLSEALTSHGIRCPFRAGNTAFLAQGRLCSLLEMFGSPYLRVSIRAYRGLPLKEHYHRQFIAKQIKGRPLGQNFLHHPLAKRAFVSANGSSYKKDIFITCFMLICIACLFDLSYSILRLSSHLRLKDINAVRCFHFHIRASLRGVDFSPHILPKKPKY